MKSKNRCSRGKRVIQNLIAFQQFGPYRNMLENIGTTICRAFPEFN